MAKLTFLGAAGEVTGSCYLVETGAVKFLVECGLFQGGLSSHADRTALLGWLGNFRRPPRQTWVVHGESIPAHALRDALQRRGWNANVPYRGQAVELDEDRQPVAAIAGKRTA